MMMLWLHLFSDADIVNTHCTNLLFYGHRPLAYALTKLTSICVPIYIILGGYGMAATWQASGGKMNNLRRTKLLMVNFWIVFLLFVPFGLFLRPDIYPGSALELLLNATALSYSYNGAWWFLLPYVLLVLCSQPLIKTFFNASLRKSAWFILLFLLVYVMTYVAKDYVEMQPAILPSVLLTIINTLYFLFIFSAGILSYKYDVISRLRHYVNSQRVPHIYWLMLAGLLLICLLRISIGNSALLHFPFVCLIIPLIVLLPKPHWLTTVLLFFGKHSTNMWLCHYFFISYLLDKQVYQLHYPLLIWGAVMAASLLASMVVGAIFSKVKKQPIRA